MTFPSNPLERSPKGDHNRRLSLGLDETEFANAAGVTVEQLKHYEFADTDEISAPGVAQRIGIALERLEQSVAPKVDNGPAPKSESADGRVYMALQSDALAARLAAVGVEEARQIISAELLAVDPAIRVHIVETSARGPHSEYRVEWSGPDGQVREATIVLPLAS